MFSFFSFSVFFFFLCFFSYHSFYLLLLLEFLTVLLFFHISFFMFSVSTCLLFLFVSVCVGAYGVSSVICCSRLHGSFFPFSFKY